MKTHSRQIAFVIAILCCGISKHVGADSPIRPGDHIAILDGTTQTGIVTFKSDKHVVVRDAAQAGKEVRLTTAARTVTIVKGWFGASETLA